MPKIKFQATFQNLWSIDVGTEKLTSQKSLHIFNCQTITVTRDIKLNSKLFYLVIEKLYCLAVFTLTNTSHRLKLTLSLRSNCQSWNDWLTLRRWNWVFSVLLLWPMPIDFKEFDTRRWILNKRLLFPANTFFIGLCKWSATERNGTR